ncbi:hypothetical protein BC30077_0857 [Bacillus cereus]|nr:hypothetical protein BC30077_0857 [Bacillus cereus]
MIPLTGISILFLFYWCVVNQYIVIKWNDIFKKFNENIVFGIFITCMLFWLEYLFQMFLVDNEFFMKYNIYTTEYIKYSLLDLFFNFKIYRVI